MARLDPYLEVLLAEQGAQLVLRSGHNAELRGSSGTRPLSRQALTQQQVVGALAEIAPEPQRAALTRGEKLRFGYTTSKGRVLVAVDPEAEGALAAVIRQHPQEEPPLELDFHSVSRPAPPKVARPETQPPPVELRKPSAAPAKAAPPTLAPERRQVELSQVSEDPAQEMAHLLEVMLVQRASDLHLASDTAPCFRIDGDIAVADSYGPVAPARLQAMLWTIAPTRNREEWAQRKDTDFAHESPTARFRVNVFADRKGIGAVLRQIPTTIRTAEEMELTKPVLDLCHLHKGLVLVTGPTGSGKSTTLAAMIDHVNRTRDDHIITIEDPIEFVHPNRRCLVNQREVGVHTDSFKSALRAALREDPDVLLVGELRDLETIAIALETAETGHLVFGTLHTNTAPSTVDRIIDQFPADRQSQVRQMLAESLKGVIAQTLCKKVGGGRVAAQEILLCNSGISNLIREGKTFQIASMMQTGRGQGMITLNDALLDLVKRKLVLPKDALAKAVRKGELKANLEKIGARLDSDEPFAGVA